MEMQEINECVIIRYTFIKINVMSGHRYIFRLSSKIYYARTENLR
jgi:hypothetical protein